jgi:hypothetical protein
MLRQRRLDGSRTRAADGNSGKFQCAIAQMASDTITGAWGFVEYSTWVVSIGVLLGMSALMLGLLIVLLKRRDPV